MTHRTAALVVLAVVILMVARLVTSWQRFPVCCRVEAANGDRYAAIVFAEDSTKVFRTSAATSRTVQISESRWPVDHLLVINRRDRLIVVDRATIRALNPLVSENQIWADLHFYTPENSALLYSDSLDALVLIGGNSRYQAGDEKQAVRVYRLSDGKTLHVIKANRIQQVLIDAEKIVCQCNDRTEVIRQADGGIEVAVIDDPARDLESSTTRSLGTQVWRPATEVQPAWSYSTFSRVLSSSFVLAVVAPLIAILTLIWSQLFISFDPVCGPWWHVFSRLAILMGMLFLIGVPVGTAYFDASGGAIRAVFPRYMLIACAQAVGFLLLLRIRRPRHVWIAIFAACTIPMLFVPMLLAAVLRVGEIADARARSKGNFIRFGIREMLLATAAIALLMQVGRLSLPIVWIGIPMTLHLGLSYLLASEKLISFATLLICIPIVVWIVVCQQQLDAGRFRFEAILYLALVPLLFAFLGVHGQFDRKAISMATGSESSTA